MKKTITLALLAVFALVKTQAQQYTPFPTNNAEWTVIHYNYNNTAGGATPTTPTSTNVYKYMVNGEDTLIDGNHYTKLFRKDVSPTAGNYTYLGAIREDQKYVMMRSDASNTMGCTQANTDDTIYNFNAHVADSVPAIVSICGNLRKVNTEDSVSINGTYTTRRNLGAISFGLSATEVDYWIEGVGSTIEPFLRFQPIPTCACANSFDLICLKRNDTNVYLNPLYASCDATSAITAINEQASAANLKVYPNPAINHQINISYSESSANFSVRVADYMGRIVLNQKLNHSSNSIHLPQADQFYILMILNKEGQIIKTEKIYAP